MGRIYNYIFRILISPDGVAPDETSAWIQEAGFWTHVTYNEISVSTKGRVYCIDVKCGD